jgi:hypothetical protein
LISDNPIRGLALEGMPDSCTPYAITVGDGGNLWVVGKLGSGSSADVGIALLGAAFLVHAQQRVRIAKWDFEAKRIRVGDGRLPVLCAWPATTQAGCI